MLQAADPGGGRSYSCGAPRTLAAVPGRKPIPLPLESLLQLPIPSPTSPPWKQVTEATSGLAGPAPTRSKRMVVVPLLILLVLWMWLFCSGGAFNSGPNGQTLGIDYAMFYAAARVMDAGGNPYDRDLLYRAERSVLDRQHLPITERPIVRVGNPPLLFWALRPLSRLSFQRAAWIWIVSMFALAILGVLLLLRFLGWTYRLLPSLIFLAMPQVVSATYTGNLNALVFVGLTGGLLLQRRHPLAAGLVLSLAWLKPQVALPAVLLIGLFLTDSWLRLALGFLAATVTGLLATLLIEGPTSLAHWVQGLGAYTRDMAIQPQVASLAGLYVRWAPGDTQRLCEVLLVVAAAFLTLGAWYKVRRRTRPLVLSWLWFVWFLATPYAHYHDEMLLAIPLLAVLGQNGGRIAGWPGALALYAMYGSWLLFTWTPFKAQLLCLPLVLVMYCVWQLDRQQPERVSAA